MFTLIMIMFSYLLMARTFWFYAYFWYSGNAYIDVPRIEFEARSTKLYFETQKKSAMNILQTLKVIF